MISDGSEYPYRAKLRGAFLRQPPDAAGAVARHKIGDVIAILGSIDIVLGDVDR